MGRISPIQTNHKASLCGRKRLTWRHWQGWDQAVFHPRTAGPDTWKQCWGAVKIYCGSGTDFGKVAAPVSFRVPELDPEPDFVHIWRDNVTRFFASGFFHESPSPKPLKITLGSFRIFSKIREDIRKSRYNTSINDTSGKFCHRYNWCCWHLWQICGWDLAQWMRSSLVVRASDCQCTGCNGPGFDPSIRRHRGIWGAADEAVLNIVRKKKKKIPQKIFEKKKICHRCQWHRWQIMGTIGIRLQTPYRELERKNLSIC